MAYNSSSLCKAFLFWNTVDLSPVCQVERMLQPFYMEYQFPVKESCNVNLNCIVCAVF